jgi:mannose-6-phosphate isomerase-like protein (cupin superfamily)
MTVDQEQHRNYLRALGARILSEANDLKRTVEALALDLGKDPTQIQAVISGEAELETARSVLVAMAHAYPISLHDLWLEEDDTDHGVKIYRAQQSQESSRIFLRPDRTGNPAPFYEYRDTAMSRLAPFKPEWIQPLRVVDNGDPYNPDVAYNKGHLLFQGTFFIGQVNFYWESGGKRYCAELNTGDSNFITPYTPHTFASRDSEQLGLIIAVTYGGEVRRSLSDFALLQPEHIEHLVADPRNTKQAFVSLLKRQLDAESLSTSQLIARLTKAGVPAERAHLLVSEGGATEEELALTAAALNIRPLDLQVTPLLPDEEVVVVRSSAAQKRYYPDEETPAYELFELARSRHQPYHKSFALRVLGERGHDTARSVLQHHLHEYIFNYGTTPVCLIWGEEHKTTLYAEDSAYVRPLVPHRFESVEPGVPASLLMYRIPGGLSASALEEFSCFSPAGRQRVLREETRWF